ncbi:hypothetical protein TrLO_g9008 [Triparma laevis f. longispina]|uniref:EF-hand domain-containing protein n=1 Tax=Triparma laevis f. longispina TaxID=1714387 RepID=A0A9W7KT48_9STRA|nr:hypothetical protein TrLO_g9008 [Triparma laevis f. longispina]
MVFGFGKKKKKAEAEAAKPAAAIGPDGKENFPPKLETPYASHVVSKKDVQDLISSNSNVFNKSEITKLKNRFTSLHDPETGLVSVDTFCSQPEFTCSPSMVRLCVENLVQQAREEKLTGGLTQFEKDKLKGGGDIENEGDNGNAEENVSEVHKEKLRLQKKELEQLTFDNVIRLFHVLSPKTSSDEKYSFLFSSLDSDSNKTLEHEDMFLFYRITLGSKIPDKIIQSITDAAMEEIGEDSPFHNDEGRGGNTRIITEKKFKNFVDHLSLEQKMTVHF